jgi:hypothetical protein
MTDFIYLIYIGLFVITIIYLFTFNRGHGPIIYSTGPVVTKSEATYSN